MDPIQEFGFMADFELFCEITPTGGLTSLGITISCANIFSINLYLLFRNCL